MRKFRSFSYKQAHYRILSCGFDAAVREITAMRNELERFITRSRQFAAALEPLSSLAEDAPGTAGEMHTASCAVGVGPMAAVAGTFAERAAAAAVQSGCEEAIVENGGDLFLRLSKELTLGIYAGAPPFKDTLAFRIKPDQTPMAVCSSSSTMGHSLSFGKCSLTTVFSLSGALADAAATLACNLVQEESDINPALDRIMAIQGISGLMILKNDKMGLAGDIPELVRSTDPDLKSKVTRDQRSNFQSTML